MASQQKEVEVDIILQDSIPGLEVDMAGVASLAEWKGTKLEEAALALLPEVKSVVVFALEIYPEILNHTRPGRAEGQASLNDLLDRHADFLNGRLTKAAYDVAKVCRSKGLKALPLPATGCPADARFLEAVFSYKHAAQAAGLGYIGRHSLLITPDFGPRVRLSCCLTEARLEPTRAEIVDVCQRCQVCIKKCPAGAISMPRGEEPYVINKFACGTFTEASGGCSECMRLCPAAEKHLKV